MLRDRNQVVELDDLGLDGERRGLLVLGAHEEARAALEVAGVDGGRLLGLLEVVLLGDVDHGGDDPLFRELDLARLGVDLLLELGLLRGDLVGLLLLGLDRVDPELAGRVYGELDRLEFEVGEGFDEADEREVGLVRVGGLRVDEHERDVLLEQLLVERVDVEHTRAHDVLLFVLLGEDLVLNLAFLLEDGFAHLLALERGQVDEGVELGLQRRGVEVRRLLHVDDQRRLRARAVLVLTLLFLRFEARVFLQLAQLLDEVRVRFLHVVFVEALVGEDFEQVVVGLRECAVDVLCILWILSEEFRGALVYEIFRQFVDYFINKFTATLKLFYFLIVFLFVRFIVFVFSFVLLLIRLVFLYITFEFSLLCEQEGLEMVCVRDAV